MAKRRCDPSTVISARGRIGPLSIRTHRKYERVARLCILDRVLYVVVVVQRDLLNGVILPRYVDYDEVHYEDLHIFAPRTDMVDSV